MRPHHRQGDSPPSGDRLASRFALCANAPTPTQGFPADLAGGETTRATPLIECPARLCYGAPVRPTLSLKRLRPNSDLPLPAYKTELASGMDLHADIDGELTLQSLERFAVPTGLAMEIPPGFEGQVRPRSGLALNSGLTCLNTPGTIDADYRGEVKVILVNVSAQPVTIKRGERIAQLVIARVERANVEEVREAGLSQTARGEGGFGSTGRS